MEKIKGSANTETFVMDKPGEGGACHEYTISSVKKDDHGLPLESTRIKFQKGSIAEVGVNGCKMEDVMDILMHRLEGFQSGEFACQENGLALSYIKMAKQALERRTNNRQLRGVEGKRKA